jgi:Protein of unknown function (DUF4236)
MRGLRFQKRLSFGPGRINFSRSGLSSISLGRLGLWLTVGSRRQVTLGWPGSGIRLTKPLTTKSSGGTDGPWLWLLGIVAAIVIVNAIF